VRALRPTRAIVDASRLRANLRELAGLAAPARLAPVVKANAYGHGAVAVVAAIGDLVDAVCVATVEEALELRASGFAGRLVVLAEPPAEAAAACAASELEVFVESERFVKALANEAHAQGRQARVHVDVDTGMHRTGIAPARAGEFAMAVRGLGIEVVGVASHLACAEEGPEHATTQAQVLAFEEAARAVGAPERHLLATAGLLSLPAARYERVRAGIGLYGYAPVSAPIALAPVLRVVTRVVRIEALEPGAAVSYGHRRPLERPGEVVTIPAGYADGVPRRAFEAGLAFVARGLRLPIVGTVTMDHTMLLAPPGALEVGDEVELLGDQVSAAEWASLLGTIPYEVLARLGPRIPREVVHGSGA